MPAVKNAPATSAVMNSATGQPCEKLPSIRLSVDCMISGMREFAIMYSALPQLRYSVAPSSLDCRLGRRDRTFGLTRGAADLDIRHRTNRAAIPVSPGLEYEPFLRSIATLSERS